MARDNIQIELSFYIKATNPGELPLEVYDALYYSGHFEPIYRIQGDMVLSAFYNESGRQEGKLSKLGRRVLKELTIDLKEKHKGVEIKVENLMPVFEEENSFYRDPKVRISTKMKTGSRGVVGAVDAESRALAATETILLGVRKLSPLPDGRISFTISGAEFDSTEMKEIHSRLTTQSARSSGTKHVWNIDFKREALKDLLTVEVMPVLEKTVG